MYLTVEVTKTAGAEQAPETEAGLPSVGSTEQTLTHRPQEDDMATKENIRRSNSDNPYYLSAVGIRKVATELIDQMTMTMACRNSPGGLPSSVLHTSRQQLRIGRLYYTLDAGKFH